MEVPRYCRDRHQPNNVASIWLLRGMPKHVCFHHEAVTSQRRFVPRPKGFQQQSFDLVAATGRKVHVPEQSSLKREEA
jgi:hypothetical protein